MIMLQSHLSEGPVLYLLSLALSHAMNPKHGRELLGLLDSWNNRVGIIEYGIKRNKIDASQSVSFKFQC